MGRQVGSIAAETLVTIPVLNDWVMTSKKKRYVFLCHIQPRVYEATRQAEDGGRKMYDKFTRCIRMGLYNIVKIYGLDAIDIDEPQSIMVSVRLKFIVIYKTEDDEVTLKEIKKPTL